MKKRKCFSRLREKAIDKNRSQDDGGARNEVKLKAATIKIKHNQCKWSYFPTKKCKYLKNLKVRIIDVKNTFWYLIGMCVYACVSIYVTLPLCVYAYNMHIICNDIYSIVEKKKGSVNFKINRCKQ